MATQPHHDYTSTITDLDATAVFDLAVLDQVAPEHRGPVRFIGYTAQTGS
ncbi:hypothetical protein AB0C38_26195 [Amycolatopsis sp. NPDC048633]